MKYITLHWTAGRHTPNADDLQHYHYVIDGRGNVLPGMYPPEANLPPVRTGKYAKHVKRANSFNIGVSMCGMADATWANAINGRYGQHAITKASVESAIHLCADLCWKYGIPPTTAGLIGHEEWDSIHGKPQDRWDVCCIPHLDIRPERLADGSYTAMNWFRQQVATLTAATPAPDFQPLFNHIAAMFDDPEFPNLPAATQRAMKVLRKLPPFDQLAREP